MTVALQVQFMVFGILLISACSRTSDSSLRKELRRESANKGLALVSSSKLLVHPFDGPSRSIQSEYRFPIVVFGKLSRMVLWWTRPDPFNFAGSFVIDSIDGRRIRAVAPPLSTFHPLALNEAAGRIAFWGKPPGKGSKDGLYWANFDVSRVEFVAENTRYADWSPDGAKLVYDKNNQVLSFDVESGSSRKLTDGHSPTWSPNGNLIAFVAPDGKAAVVTTEGVREEWPLSSHLPISAIQWSPTGSYVNFSEKVPTQTATFGKLYRLVVCRVSDGQTATIESSSWDSDPSVDFTWILNYREFCKHCSITVF